MRALSMVDRRCISAIALFIAIAILMSNTVAISRDYQDSWILEGLEIPFLLFIITYVSAFFSEKRISWLVVLAVTGRIIFLLIPNMKYVWFQGIAVDQNVQLSLANHVLDEGHVSILGPSAYTSMPLQHLSYSIFSMVLNIPVVDSMKYLPVFLSAMYPLLTYVIAKELEFSEKTAMLKYALFISSVPFTPEQYIVTGTLFGILTAFLIVSNLVFMFQKKERHYWSTCIIFIFALAASHAVTSIILPALLLSLMILQRVPHFRPKSFLRASVTFTVASISVAWLMFSAAEPRTLEAISRQLFVHLPAGTTPASEYIPSTFFELARVDVLQAVKTLLVYYGADVCLLLLTLAGLLVLFKMLRQSNNTANFLFLFGTLALSFMLIGAVLRLGATRTLHFGRLLFPVFSGIAFFYIHKKRSWICPIMLCSIVFLATIELYGCQPLIPSANILYEDLPAREPIGYVNQVNSIYQRLVVDFVHNHVVGRIASDVVTKNQIIGLLGYDFMVTHSIRYYPLDRRQPSEVYDCFIIHTPGKSGNLREKAEFRTTELILGAINNSSIVYNNGESYALTNNQP